ncbi:MAG: BspA family leucine-rich repeat surface protein [Lachnospiraceae bacterium]|nr:BspA family leucine-rich repeat surface protein [Lachnospiraceae bacterium]
MRKGTYLKKRMLALALSAAMVFASTDTYVVLAAETENIGGLIEDSTSRNVEGETTPVVQREEADSAGENALSDEIDETGDTDTTDDSDGAGEDGSTGDSDDAGEDGSTGNSDDAGEDDTTGDTDESDGTDNKGDTNESDVEDTKDDTDVSGETDISDADESLQDEAESLSITASGDVDGIHWEIDADGLLTITGTGDYGDYAPWYRNETVLSAKVTVSGITSTRGMFYGCHNLKNVDFSGSDTSQVTDMSHMFENCYRLEEVNLENINTSKVTDMNSMFMWCEKLTSLDLTSFDVSQVTNMSKMFHICGILNTLTLGNFDTSNVTDMSQMFAGCGNLPVIDLSGFKTNNVSDMKKMFHSCGALTSLDLSNLDTSNVTDMSEMFYGCINLTSLDLSNLDASNVADMKYMFYGCEKLETVNLEKFCTSSVTDTSYMFDRCYVLSSLDLSDFDTSKVLNMESMFQNCNNLNSLNLKSFNTKNVTNMSNMFYKCSSLSGLDLGNFDTGNVTDMSHMFESCEGLTSLDLTNLDTSRVENMASMFYECSNLKSVDLGNFNTKQVTDMTNMFDRCTSLESLDLSSFDMSRVEYYGYMLNKYHVYENLAYICTPINVKDNIDLPSTSKDSTWYSKNGDTYIYFPQNLDHSIVLYCNGYPGDGNETIKEVAVISGIEISSKTYDGGPNQYTGAAVVTDSEGVELDISTSITCTGTLADGSLYQQEGSEAPSQAGQYQLSVSAESDTYIINNKTYGFHIRQKDLTITAPSREIEVGGQIPDLSGMSCTIEGLINGENLQTGPSLRYDRNPDSSQAGSFRIIPDGAVAGNNYNIIYVLGTLTIKPPVGDDDPDDDSDFETTERADLETDVYGTIAGIKAKTYDGSAYEPTVKVTVKENNKKKTLTEGTDYRVQYLNNVNAGTGTVVVRGNGKYKGKITQTFTIKPKSIGKLKVVVGSMVVGGDSANPPIYVYDGGSLIDKNTGYTLSGNDNITVLPTKAAKVTIAGMGNYTGTRTVKIAVYDKEEASHIINPGNVTLSISEAAYTGRAITDDNLEVKIDDSPLTKNKDYKVQYKNNKDAGTAFVIVTGKGSYKGTVVKTFKITPIEPTLEIKDIADKTYNAKLQKPSVTVKVVGGKKLKKNKDYTVAYKSNLHAGTATVIVTGKDNYTSVITKTFNIKPQKISRVSVKGTKENGLIVTYSKRQLKLGVNYTLDYHESKKNKIKVTISAVERDGKISDFTGSVDKNVKIK